MITNVTLREPHIPCIATSSTFGDVSWSSSYDGNDLLCEATGSVWDMYNNYTLGHHSDIGHCMKHQYHKLA